jgi:hypothetical protein
MTGRDEYCERRRESEPERDGDPQQAKPRKDQEAAVLQASELPVGFFFGLPEATGPFTSATNGTVNLGAVANTYAFDPAVSASSGDVWAVSVNPNASYTPLSLDPGETGTITVTFTPSATKGIVRGFLGVDTFDPDTASGDEVTTIPYTYKVR